MFSCEFCKMFKNNFFTEHLQKNASVKGSLVIVYFCLILKLLFYVQSIIWSTITNLEKAN